MREIDVAIVGGGPVGLCASLQLSRLGVRHVLLERNVDVSAHPKSRGLNTRSMELLRLWGLHDETRAVGMGIDPVFFFGRDMVSPWLQVFRPREAMKERGDQDLSPCDLVMELCSQDALEPILRRAAAANPIADVRFGWEAHVSADDGGCVVTAKNSDGVEESWRARYVIAADGANSALRRQFDVPVESFGTTLEAISVLFRSDFSPLTDTPAGFFKFFNPETVGVVVIAPVDANGRGALLGRPNIMNERAWDEIDWLEQLRLAVGAPDHPFEVIDVRAWRAAVAIAERYRAGPVFFVGDSAHVMPPNGGFNMNTGLQDVHNLAWKLKAVIAGWADEALLDSYDAERRPVARFNALEAGKNLEALMHEHDDNGVGFRFAHYIHPGVALGYRYGDGAVVYETGQDRKHQWPVSDYTPDAAPGARAPHVWLTTAQGERISSIDLFEDSFVLLTGDEASAAWAGAVRDAASLGAPLRHYVIGAGGLSSAHMDFHALYGIGATGAVLVRPDGHVAWRAKDLAPSGLQKALATVLSLSQSPVQAAAAGRA